jgi:hypothetical protein
MTKNHALRDDGAKTRGAEEPNGKASALAEVRLTVAALGRAGFV